MTAIQHTFAKIYDRLNDQPDLQDLIATPILQELDFDEKEYNLRKKPLQNAMIYQLKCTIDQIWLDKEYITKFYFWYNLVYKSTLTPRWWYPNK